MSDSQVAVVILAAGQGSRMQSDLPKVLHRLGGVPLVGHALAAGRSLDPARVVVVAGHGAEAVTKAVGKLDPEAQVALQAEQLGTGHAVAQALPLLEGFAGRVVVLYGDTPFISAETLAALAEVGAIATGTVITEPPIDALAATIEHIDGREAIILTRPHVVAEFFHVDWTSRARRKLGVPVLHLLEHERFSEQTGGGEGVSGM